MNTKEKIIEEIRKIYDPELPVNIYELGLIYDIQVEEKKAKIKNVNYHKRFVFVTVIVNLLN